MPSLPDELFSLLENKTLQARETAEKAARNITAYLKVENSAWWGEKDDPQRNLWLGLRARARQLGYAVEEDGERDSVKRGLPQLVEEIAYEQWHRMLFARFLAENNLLMHPSGVAVSLAVDDAPGPDSLRGVIERNAIALLSNYIATETPLDPPSSNWLGHLADRETIRRSGLWNVNHVTETYEPAFLGVLEGLVNNNHH